mgnify:CR=1 FL=1
MERGKRKTVDEKEIETWKRFGKWKQKNIQITQFIYLRCIRLSLQLLV